LYRVTTQVYEEPAMRLPRRVTVTLILALMLAFIALIAWLMWREVRQSRLDHLLITAIRSNDARAMAAALKRGADPNARDAPIRPLAWRDLLKRWLHPAPLVRRADTALLLAAQQENDFGGAQLLIRAGANVNAANAHGDTPLSAALAQTHVAIMCDLLLHGANPNAPMTDWNDRPSTILIQTIEANNQPVFGETTCRDLVRLLLEHGADPNAVDDYGETALLVAIESNQEEVAQQLMERGVDINRADKEGETPLHASCVGDHDKIRDELLRRGADVTPAHNAGWDLACWAAEQNETRVLKIALDRGIGADSRDKRGRTPLMFAAAHSSQAALQLLLKRGARVDLCDHLGWTALMFAAQNDDPKIVETLLEHGANPRLRDGEQRWTAAERAAACGQEENARLLHASRSRPSRPDERRQRSETEQAMRLQGVGDSEEQKPMLVPLGDAVRMKRVLVPEGNYDRQCRVKIVDADGRAGKTVTLPFVFMPMVRLFSDVDGRRYACFTGHHRSETIYLEAIQGRNLVEKWQLPQEMAAADCQPLAGGGALITRLRRTQYMDSIPARHKGDIFREVFRFRNGKTRRLGLVILPQQ
jgi:ankyrin repeat protein